MRFKTWYEVDAAGYTGECGPLFRIDTICFNTYIDDSGETKFDDAWFWENEQGTDTHWFDCFFTDLDEARLYCKCFDEKVARWTKTHGTGKHFDHVAVEVNQMEWDVWPKGAEWVPGCAVSTYDWMWGVQLEQWHDIDISEDRACRI